jgi:spore germination protein YaaH
VQTESPNPTNTSVLPTVTPKAINTVLTLGYYTGAQESYDALVAYAPFLNIVSSDVFSVEMDGTLTGGDDFEIAAFNRKHNIQTFACVSNYNNDPNISDFDPHLAQAALVSHPNVVKAEIMKLLHSGDFAGVNIDFESLAFSEDIEDDRAAFTAFIHDLSMQLHRDGYRLIVSVPGKTEDDVEDTWSYPFDLAALGQDADYLQLMTYDQHGPWGEPGSVAGANWVEECLAYTTSLVDPAKLLIGLPAYGYDWDLNASDPESEVYSAESFSWKDVPGLMGKTRCGAALG